MLGRYSNPAADMMEHLMMNNQRAAEPFEYGVGSLGASRLFSEMNQLLDQPPGWSRNNRASAVPICNIVETPTSYFVCCELPGCAKESICCEFKERNVLCICADRVDNPNNSEPTTNIIRHERYCGKIRRQFELPHDVDDSKITCEYVNGVLECTIPKKSDCGAKVLKITCPTETVGKKK